MKLTKNYLKRIIKEELEKELNTSQSVLSPLQQRYIAAAVTTRKHEEYWPDDSMDGSDIEEPEMYQWAEDVGPYQGDPDDKEAAAEHGATADSWHVRELKKPPAKFPEAKLGWYVIHHPFFGNRKAIAGPFENWKAAAKEADKYGKREHMYR